MVLLVSRIINYTKKSLKSHDLSDFSLGLFFYTPFLLYIIHMKKVVSAYMKDTGVGAGNYRSTEAVMYKIAYMGTLIIAYPNQ